MDRARGKYSRTLVNSALIACVSWMVVVWIAGGASRSDVLGQPVVRFFAWCFLLYQVLSMPSLGWRWRRPVVLIFLAAVILIAVQLIPLPPQLWAQLPGRALLAGAAQFAGQPQPWRAISISPAATINALGAMVVPLATLAAMSRLDRRQRSYLPAIILAMAFASSLVGLLQMTGANLDNPLINDVRGSVSGNFANQNHFALFLAIGCLILPIWAVAEGARNWRLMISALVAPFFVLVALGSGSRMGILLVLVATFAGFFAVRERALAAFRRLPRLPTLAVGAGAGVAIVAIVILSIWSGRAVSLDRALSLEAGADLRNLARPVIWAMALQYFPVGTGFGTFDTAYRIAEPYELLQTTYLNHAHNDWLELFLDGGLLAVVLAAAALIWWGMASWKAWRGTDDSDSILARAGSAMILLIMIASITDYPARTPLIMLVLVVGAMWLERSWPAGSGGEPGDGRGRA